jgi:hypothetical protein
MTVMKTNDAPWNQLAQAAARAPEREIGEPPLGFATRMIAGWKTRGAEGVWSALDFFTWRGLAVAAVILAGSVMLGYEELSGFIAGDTSLPEDMVQSISNLMP